MTALSFFGWQYGVVFKSPGELYLVCIIHFSVNPFRCGQCYTSSRIFAVLFRRLYSDPCSFENRICINNSFMSSLFQMRQCILFRYINLMMLVIMYFI